MDRPVYGRAVQNGWYDKKYNTVIIIMTGNIFDLVDIPRELCTFGTCSNMVH